MTPITRLSAVTAALLLISLSAQAVSVTVYDTKTAWQNAVDLNFTTEHFDDSSMPEGVSVASAFGGYVTDGHWCDAVGETTTGRQDCTLWHFDQPIQAFGANWNCRPQGGGTGLKLIFGYMPIVFPIDPNTWLERVPGGIGSSEDGGFFGFVSGTPFHDVMVGPLGDVPNLAEHYWMDKMVWTYAPDDGPSVPEPMGLATVSISLAAVGSYLRRRRVARDSA